MSVKLDDLIVEKMIPWRDDNEDDDPVWVIGDVHGCGNQYRELLEKIYNETPSALIYQLGDLIDRGPDFLEVFRLCDDYNVVTLMGNHELNFYHEAIGFKSCRSKTRLLTHSKFECMTKKNQEFVMEWIGTSPIRAEVKSNGLLWRLSHSLPKMPVKTFDVTNGSNMCYLSDPDIIDKRRNELRNYVHGHMHWSYIDIYEQIGNRKNNIFNIDSGCCYGNKLTALELSSLQVIQVDGIDYSTNL